MSAVGFLAHDVAGGPRVGAANLWREGVAHLVA
jgi:hypothetical protein